VVDLFARKRRGAWQYDVAVLALVDSAGMRSAALRLDILSHNALDEQLRQVPGVTTEPDPKSVDIQDGLQMGDQLDADGDTLPDGLPVGPVLGRRRDIRPPDVEQVTSDGRTTRRRRLSELLPALGPGRPEGTIDAGRRFGRQADDGRIGAPRGVGERHLLPAEPIEPSRHALALSLLTGC